MRTRNHLGFTLIELMVTVTILAIVLAIAIPNFTDWLNRKKVDGIANDFASLVQLARSESIKRNKIVYIQATRTADDDWSIMAALDSDTSTPAFDSCTALTTQCDLRNMQTSNYPQVKISEWNNTSKVGISNLLNGTAINPIDSLLTFNGGTEEQSITFQVNNYQLRTKVSRTGLTTICVPTGQTAIAGYPTC